MLHSAFLKIRNKPELLLDYEPLYCQLPDFHDYMDYFKEQKEWNVIGSSNCHRVLIIDKLMSKQFWPTKQDNPETTKFCHVLAVDVANTLLAELKDIPKATFEYLLSANGQ